MIKVLSNIPISRRLLVSFAVFAAVPSIIIIFLSTFYLQSLAARGQAVQTSFAAQGLAAEQVANLELMNARVATSLNNIVAGQSGAVADTSLVASGGLIFNDISARETFFEVALANYQANYELATSANMSNVRSILLNDNPQTHIIRDQQQALNESARQWSLYKQEQDTITQQLAPLERSLLHKSILSHAQLNAAYGHIYQLYYVANAHFTTLSTSWQQVSNDAIAMGTTVTAVGPSLSTPIIIATVVAIVLTFLVVFLIGWLVNRTISQPLRRLAQLTRRISKGDRNARAKVVGRDEIALVASSMNGMLDNIVHLIQEAQQSREALEKHVEKLVSEVSGVGEGDLRVQAEVTTDALGVLADSFNYMVEELGSLVVRVKMVAHEVEDSTTMTYERMSQLVTVADTQIEEITGAAVEVESMANSSRDVAERAQVLYGVAREARLTAQNGRGAVQQTVEGIERIDDNVKETAEKVQLLGDRSREIKAVTEIIANLAHQTNRLALDAAIQAAMAGDNGKGFGAVAADIRRLAERAKDQVTSINRIVRSVLEDIGAVAMSMQDTERETSRGTELAQEAGHSLETIFGVVERQAAEIEAINHMTEKQLQSSGTVVRIMQAVSGSTQRGSASTREAAHNMERVARLAEQLLASVEAFKLRENLNYYAPVGTMTISPEQQHQQSQSLSGAFRTVTASAYPSQSEWDPRFEPVSMGNSWQQPSYPYNNAQDIPSRDAQTHQQRNQYPPQFKPRGERQ